MADGAWLPRQRAYFEETMGHLRIDWRLKAILPVAGVLLAGLLVFAWVTLSLGGPERQKVILAAAGGAVAICAVLLAALAVLIQRPLIELRHKIALLREGDLSVT